MLQQQLLLLLLLIVQLQTVVFMNITSINTHNITACAIATSSCSL